MIIRDILQLKGNVVYSIPPTGTAAEAVGLMVEHDIGSLVVMRRGQLVGMLTFREVLKALHSRNGDLNGVTVGEMMVSQPILGGPGDTVEYARGVMSEHHLRYLPVIESHTLLGVISFRDVAKACLDEASFENRLLKRYIKHWPEPDVP